MSQAASRPVALDEQSIVIVTSLGHAVCHMGELAFTGVRESLGTEFGLDPFQASSLGLLGYVLMGVGAIPAGLWADAWGPRRVFGVYFVSLAVACLGVVVAPNTWALFAAFTSVGLAVSLYHPVGVALLSLGVSPSSRGRAMGINGVAGSIGVAVGPALGMAASWLGPGMWRLAYVVVAAAALLAGGLMWLASRKSAGREVTRPVGTTLGVIPGVSGGWLALVPLGLLLAAMTFGGLNYRMLTAGLPPFFGGGEASQQLVGAVQVFFILVAGAIGQYGGGWLGDRVGARRVYPFLIGSLAVTALLLSGLYGSGLALPVACLAAISLFASQPVENSLVAEWTSGARRSSWYGLKFALTFGLGALGLQIEGWVRTWTGSVEWVFVVLATSAVVMGLLAVAALVTHGRRTAAEAERRADLSCLTSEKSVL